MNTGNLDRKLIIQYNTGATKGAEGEPIEVWATFATVWGRKSSRGGRESVQGAEQVAVREDIYIIRWLNGLTEKMRIMDGSDSYNITFINEIGRRSLMEVSAFKRDNDNTN
jgi:head-tail adaptor